MRTSNPTLSDQVFIEVPIAADDPNRMTLQGTVTKSAILLSLTFTTALMTCCRWTLYTYQERSRWGPGMTLGPREPPHTSKMGQS